MAYLLQLALPSGKPVTDVAVWKIEHPPEALSHFGALAAPRDPDPAVAALRDTCLECWVDAGDLDEANNSLFDVCRRGFAFPRSGASGGRQEDRTPGTPRTARSGPSSDGSAMSGAGG